MSIHVMAWVWTHGPTEQTERFVMLAMADIADEQGMCWPSVATIAARCCMSERNARRVIRRLEEGGWLAIEVHPGRNRTNTYRMQKPDTAMSARTDCPPGQIEHENRTNATLKPDTAMSAEPSRTINEPSVKNARARAGSDAKAISILSEVIPTETAEAFAQHRRAKRAKLTENAATILAKRLAGCRDPVAAVEDAIANGWTGIFPREGPEQPQQAPAFDFDAAYEKGLRHAG